MPYKKPKRIPGEEFSRLLKGYDLNAPALAQILGCSIPTARKKLTEPGRFTLMDIARIHSHGHISIEELRNAIKG